MAPLVLLTLCHAQTPLLEHRLPAVTQVGGSATGLVGVDSWLDRPIDAVGGGPSGEAAVALGARHGSGLSTLSAGYGAVAQGWITPSAQDAHLGQVQLLSGSGLGSAVEARGSAAQRWGQLGADAVWARGPGRVEAGPVTRLGVDGNVVGARGGLGLELEAGKRTELGLTARGTWYGDPELPVVALGRAGLWLDLGRRVDASLGGTVIGAAGGLPVSALGLPAGDSLVGRLDGSATCWLGSRVGLELQLAAERGVGSVDYWRGRALAGVRIAGARARTRLEDRPAGTFRLELRAPDAEKVTVAGSFTDWEPVALAREGGLWVVEIPVAPGLHEYVYLVDDVPLVPPEATATRDDGFGGRNAVVVVSGPTL